MPTYDPFLAGWLDPRKITMFAKLKAVIAMKYRRPSTSILASAVSKHREPSRME